MWKEGCASVATRLVLTDGGAELQERGPKADLTAPRRPQTKRRAQAHTPPG